MVILRNLKIELSTDQVLRRQGMGGKVRSEIDPRIYEMTAELMGDLGDLLKPAMAYELHQVAGIQPMGLILADGTRIRGSLLPSTLPNCMELAVFVCTIGPDLEERVTEYSAGGKLLRATMLDGIGSAAVDSLVHKACQIAQEEAKPHGYGISGAIFPGTKGFPLAEQPTILGLAHGDEIGVELTSSAMMIPRKSTSCVIGMGLNVPFWEVDEACDYCSLKDTCRYRSIV